MALTVEQIQKAYIAFFNRPADATGLAFWVNYPGSAEDLLNTFSTTPEYLAEYAGKTPTQIVNAVYVNLFGRPAEAGGLAFWAGHLTAGTLTIGNIAITILNNAGAGDKEVIDNKTRAAIDFTDYLASHASAKAAYETGAAVVVEVAKDWLSDIGASIASKDGAISAIGSIADDLIDAVANDPDAGYEVIRFPDDGHAWRLNGYETNEKVYGTRYDDIMYGNGGDDWLIGGMGMDTLDGGVGNDILEGGPGSDIYNYSIPEGGISRPGASNGHDIIHDSSGMNDQIVLPLFSQNQAALVDLERSGTRLILHLYSASPYDDTITIENYYADSRSATLGYGAIEKITNGSTDSTGWTVDLATVAATLTDAATFSLAKYFNAKPGAFLSEGAKSVLGILDADQNEKYFARWNFPEVMGEPANKPFTAGIGKSVVITYTFLRDRLPDYYTPGNKGYASPASGNNYNQFSAFSEEQKDSTRKALAQIAEVANITFIERTETRSSVGDITFANLPLDIGVAGHAYLPAYQYTTIANRIIFIDKLNIGGDVWINGANVWSPNDWKAGGDGFATLLHEIGHALGLKHPHDENYDNTVLSPSLDDDGHTVMSYNTTENSLITGNSGYLDYLCPSTLMPFDIEALQYLYGAKNTTRTGNDTYHWDANANILQTIWDAGGVDTIDASNQAQSIINLNAGGYSSIGLRDAAPGFYSGRDNLAIAKGVVIENAKGGSGNDTLIGNEADNRLEGGLGNDTYAGYKLGAAIGNDDIRDTGGNDRIEIANARRDAGLENVEIRHLGGNLVLTLSADNSITMLNFYASGTTPGSGAIETLAGTDWLINLVGVADDLAANSYITLGDIWSV